MGVEKPPDEARVGVKGQSNPELVLPEMPLGAASGEPAGGRATDRTRGLHRLSTPDELRMPAARFPGVSRRVLMSGGERERARSAGQGPQ